MNLYENIKDNLQESVVVDTGFADEKTKDILQSVIGQLSDGMWENTPSMKRFWAYMDTTGNGKIEFNTDNWESGFKDKDEEQIRKWLAGKIKQIVKEEGLQWDRNNTEVCDYLDRGSKVTVRDAYKVYDRLLGRKDYITDSDGTNFDEIALSKQEARSAIAGSFELLLEEIDEDEEYACEVFEQNIYDEILHLLEKKIGYSLQQAIDNGDNDVSNEIYNKFVDEIYQNLNISLDEAAQKLSNIFTIALVNHGYLKKAMNEAVEVGYDDYYDFEHDGEEDALYCDECGQPVKADFCYVSDETDPNPEIYCWPCHDRLVANGSLIDTEEE